ncbi:hypothetical protein AB4262_08610 [Vibrio breoganii]
MKEHFSLLPISILLLITSGCAGNAQDSSNTMGAVAIPFSISYDGVNKFTCRRFDLKFDDQYKSGYLTNGKRNDNGDLEGYLYIDDMPTGYQLLTEIRCYPHRRTQFKNGKKHITRKVSQSVNIKPNTVLVAPFLLRGSIEDDYGTHQLYYGLTWTPTATREDIAEEITANDLQSNWNVTLDQDY